MGGQSREYLSSSLTLDTSAPSIPRFTSLVATRYKMSITYAPIFILLNKRLVSKSTPNWEQNCHLQLRTHKTFPAVGCVSTQLVNKENYCIFRVSSSETGNVNRADLVLRLSLTPVRKRKGCVQGSSDVQKPQ